MKYCRIREMREDKDFTQEYMANLLSITPRAYGRYESGEREIPIAALCKLADFHGVSVDYLLGRTDILEPYPVSKR